jgi:hypothetical protein
MQLLGQDLMALTACQESVLKRQILLVRKYTITQPLCQATAGCAIQSNEMWAHFTHEDSNCYVMFECVHHTEWSKMCIPYGFIYIHSIKFLAISEMF